MPIDTAKEFRHPLTQCRPLGDRVIVEIAVPAKQTRGGIHLPDATAKNEKPQIGKIIAVGQGRYGAYEPGDPLLGNHRMSRIPVELEVGQRVFFLPYTGSRWQSQEYQGDKDYIILKEDDILTVFDADAELPSD